MNDRIQKVIDNLKALTLDGGSHENLSAICDVLYGGEPDFGWTKGACEWLRDALVGLLEQHDPDEWSDSYLAEVGIVRLPKDERGEVIHVGDELCGYGRPDGGVFCKATNGVMVYVGEIGDDAPKQWLVWDPDNCHHYHKPTVEEILDELEGLRGTGGYEAVVTRAAKLAGQLRELMQDD